MTVRNTVRKPILSGSFNSVNNSLLPPRSHARKLLTVSMVTAGLVCLSVLFTSCSTGSRNKNEIEFWTLQLSPTFDHFIHGMISRFEIQKAWIPLDSYLFQVLVSEGDPILSPNGRRAEFNSPEGIRVIRKWVKAFRDGAMPRESILTGHRGGTDGVYLMRQFFKSVPKDIEGAAAIDGCSPLRVWWNVLMPLSKPAVATLSVFTFVSSWSNVTPHLWFLAKPLAKRTARQHFCAFLAPLREK